MKDGKLKVAYVITQRNGKNHWTRIGVGFVNRDGIDQHQVRGRAGVRRAADSGPGPAGEQPDVGGPRPRQERSRDGRARRRAGVNVMATPDANEATSHRSPWFPVALKVGGIAALLIGLAGIGAASIILGDGGVAVARGRGAGDQQRGVRGSSTGPAGLDGSTRAERWRHGRRQGDPEPRRGRRSAAPSRHRAAARRGHPGAARQAEALSTSVGLASSARDRRACAEAHHAAGGARSAQATRESRRRGRCGGRRDPHKLRACSASSRVLRAPSLSRCWSPGPARRRHRLPPNRARRWWAQALRRPRPPTPRWRRPSTRVRTLRWTCRHASAVPPTCCTSPATSAPRWIASA